MYENRKDNTESKRQKWIQDLQEDILEDEWGIICAKAQTQTINTRLSLIQYNWVMRTYITPVKLNTFDPIHLILIFPTYFISAIHTCLGERK